MTAVGRVAVVLGVMAVVFLPAPAQADPPGPTDFRTEVTEIDPPTDGLAVDIIGGDSFVRLHVDPGREVSVVGYRGEPYLRFGADGTVEENRASPTTYLNLDRYAESDVPTTATPDAVPTWVVVADGGSYSWHDHRAHWMNEARPLGRVRGDVVLEGVIPLVVDGVAVDVTVVSVWQRAPSPLPAVIGAVMGGVAALVAGRRGVRWSVLVVGGIAGMATAMGAVAYFSVPGETGPPLVWWAPPAIAAVLSLAAGTPPARPYRSRLAAAAAALLMAWAVMRREWLTRAVLPSAAPFWLDRAVIAGTLAAALVAVVMVLWAVVRPRPLRSPP